MVLTPMLSPMLCAMLAGASPGSAPAPPPAAAGDAQVTWTAPSRLILGHGYRVEVRLEAPAGGAGIANWLLTPSAFTVDGKPLGARTASEVFQLAPGSVLTLELDLAPILQGLEGFGAEDFVLGYAKELLENEAIEVRVFRPAPDDVDFLTVPVEDLARYQVVMETSRGQMVFEFLPDKAPMHVRNFLGLCQSGFYEGILFHRVSPRFMIQGGCPNTKTPNTRLWGQGSGPRRLDAEFSDEKHKRGVLSMARGNDVNSASSQFFVMTADSFFLDTKYSAFGRLVSGEDTLDAIGAAPGVVNPRDQTVRPNEPQKILSTVVIQAGGEGEDGE